MPTTIKGYDAANINLAITINCCCMLIAHICHGVATIRNKIEPCIHIGYTSMNNISTSCFRCELNPSSGIFWI